PGLLEALDKVSKQNRNREVANNHPNTNTRIARKIRTNAVATPVEDTRIESDGNDSYSTFSQLTPETTNTVTISLNNVNLGKSRPRVDIQVQIPGSQTFETVKGLLDSGAKRNVGSLQKHR